MDRILQLPGEFILNGEGKSPVDRRNIYYGHQRFTQIGFSHFHPDGVDVGSHQVPVS